MAIHVGTSGWSYDHWQGVLYPHGASSGERLECYVRHGYDTVEVNRTFYRWPRDATFASWHERLPDGFWMTVKAPRGLTHGKRLYAPEVWLERIERGVHHLHGKRGVLLVQLPPQMAYDHARLDYFLGRVPWWLPVAVEFRHPSWEREETYALLERHGAAYCVMSGAHLPCILRATSPLVYIRLHGPDPHHLYAGSYPHEDLRWWASRIGEWAAQGRTIHAYFNNDGDGHAARNATHLRHLLNR